jgi:tetratricopeptide (TPR) repeat protein
MKKEWGNSIIIGILLLITSGMPANSQDLKSGIKQTRNEQYSRANKTFQSILQKNPKDGSIYYYYGDNFLQKYFSDTLSYNFSELSDSARKQFSSGLQTDPDNPLNYIGLGEIELIKRNMNEAQSYFDKSLSLLPSRSNKNSSVSKKEQAVVYIKMANAFIKSKVNDSSKVFSLLRMADQLDKKNYDLYIVKGDAYFQILNDGSMAIENYRKAQDLNPLSPRAKLRTGQLWMKAANYPSALKYFSEAIKADSTYAPAYREMGYLLTKTNQQEKAKESFEKFLSLSAGNINTRIQYANILLNLKEYPEAIRQINVVMLKDSINNDFNRALGYSYFETGQYEKGLFYMTKFFDNTKPTKLRTSDFIYYGRLLAKNKKDSLAGEVLMKAYQMDTTQSELLNQALSEFIKMKNYNKAAEIVLNKIMLKKDVSTDYYILGQLYYNLHQWSKADSAFTLNLALNPGNIRAYLWKAYSLVNLDPESKEGLAKPTFELLIEKSKSDPVKNSNELRVAYSYLAYYYFLQYSITKNQNDGIISKGYCNKVLELEPTNTKAKTILKELSERIKG